MGPLFPFIQQLNLSATLMGTLYTYGTVRDQENHGKYLSVNWKIFFKYCGFFEKQYSNQILTFSITPTRLFSCSTVDYSKNRKHFITYNERIILF